MRKTVKVEALKIKVNKMILDLHDLDVAARRALQTLIENVLMDTGSYRGFQYLDKNDMNESKNGTSVGINIIDESLGNDKSRYKLAFANTDRTRVSYF